MGCSHLYLIPDITSQPGMSHFSYLAVNMFSTAETPFRILDKYPKAFVIDYGDRDETASIDRLKPAHLDMDKPL